MQKLLPPLLAAICMVAMLISTSWLQQAFAEEYLVRIAGGMVAALGLFVSVAAKSQFRKANTNVDTFNSPTVLITSGWYRVSRNPMYLGLVLLLVGVALLLNNMWALFGPVIFFSAAALWYIPYEEKDALATFGAPYREYCAAVRRWV